MRDARERKYREETPHEKKAPQRQYSPPRAARCQRRCILKLNNRSPQFEKKNKRQEQQDPDHTVYPVKSIFLCRMIVSASPRCQRFLWRPSVLRFREHQSSIPVWYESDTVGIFFSRKSRGAGPRVPYPRRLYRVCSRRTDNRILPE